MIKITYDLNKKYLKDLPFCYINITFLNPYKNNRQEKLIVLTS